VQQVWPHGVRTERPVARRRLLSEFLFVYVPANGTWLGFRDVGEVDGKRIRNRKDRLESLLMQKSSTSIADLKRLADESARFNIGPIFRNFNEPTLGLLISDPRYAPRFRFEKAGEQTIDGTATWEVRYTEVRRPTVIQQVDKDVPASGLLWIDPETGRVVRTELRVENESGAVGRIVVDYRFEPKLDLWVPSEMTEVYEYTRGTRRPLIECSARYSNFRRFETKARLVIPK